MVFIASVTWQSYVENASHNKSRNIMKMRLILIYTIDSLIGILTFAKEEQLRQGKKESCINTPRYRYHLQF